MDKKDFLKAFLTAGYNFSRNDRSDMSLVKKLEGYDIRINEPDRLKNICRTAIREQLRRVAEDKTIFPAIDVLCIPKDLKDFLKLYDMSKY